MSVYSVRTGLSSILKTYSCTEREKVKIAISNKVRFQEPSKKGLAQIIKEVREHNDWKPLNTFVEYLRCNEIDDAEFIVILSEARDAVNVLNANFENLVEAILSMQWTKRNPEAIEIYTKFFINIAVAHNKYINFCVSQIIGRWIPSDNEEASWSNGVPKQELQDELTLLHLLLDGLMDAIPMSFNIILDVIERKFPYFKKSQFIITGYLHNVLWLLDYKPIFMDYIMQCIVQNLLILDANSPRYEIEDCDDDDENEDIFQMDEENEAENNEKPMNHPFAHTLDICMEKLYVFIQRYNVNALPENANQEEKSMRQLEAAKFFKVLLKIFDTIILPTHNIHHVQFIVFYFCTFRPTYSEEFLNFLLSKLKNPNESSVMRQSAVGYMASYLARSKNLSMEVLKFYLKHLSEWAHQYIKSSDQYRANYSLKANLVFFAVCQAVFYVIAFRSGDLTSDKKNLLFLQSLHLSALVTCHLNPLRVCLPAVATAFAGVARTYQLAYCHAVLERNARRKLAMVYTNETATAEETLDTFFPYDPYLLKFSGSRIEPHYLQYKGSEEEEKEDDEFNDRPVDFRRKRGDSELMDYGDIDELLSAEKKQKISASAKSVERELQFTYGLSPGFHS